jgi:hypothetical protein
MTTLEEARAAVKKGRANKGGTDCPCCGKHCEEYRFSISANLAQILLVIYQAGRTLHVKEFARGNTYNTTLLKNFGLIQQEPSEDKKPFNRSGLWSITDRGKAWVEGRVRIPRYVFVFDNTVTGFSAEEWTWKESSKSTWSPEDARQDTHNKAA